MKNLGTKGRASTIAAATIGTMIAVTVFAANPAQAAQNTISLVSADKKIDAAGLKARAIAMSDAFTATYNTRSTDPESSESIKVTVDSTGDSYSYRTGDGSLYVIGMDVFITNEKEDWTLMEILVAAELGLIMDAPYARIDFNDPRVYLDGTTPDVVVAYYVEDDRNKALNMLPGAKPIAKKVGKKYSASYSKRGNVETISVKYGSKLQYTDSYTITGGVLSSYSVVDMDSKDRIRFTLKRYSEKIEAPAGPYLEYTEIATDPRVNKVRNEDYAQRILDAAAREARAFAAFSGLDTPTDAQWKEAASEREYLTAYGSSLEYAGPGSNGEPIVACGKLNADQEMIIEMVSCSSLGLIAS
jgi:hypothetical protein